MIHRTQPDKAWIQFGCKAMIGVRVENEGRKRKVTHMVGTRCGAILRTCKGSNGRLSNHSRCWHACRSRVLRQRPMLREMLKREGTNRPCTEHP